MQLHVLWLSPDQGEPRHDESDCKTRGRNPGHSRFNPNRTPTPGRKLATQGCSGEGCVESDGTGWTSAHAPYCTRGSLDHSIVFLRAIFRESWFPRRNGGFHGTRSFPNRGGCGTRRMVGWLHPARPRHPGEGRLDRELLRSGRPRALQQCGALSLCIE